MGGGGKRWKITHIPEGSSALERKLREGWSSRIFGFTSENREVQTLSAAVWLQPSSVILRRPRQLPTPRSFECYFFWSYCFHETAELSVH